MTESPDHPMQHNRLAISKSAMRIEMTGWDRVWSFKKALVIQRSSISNVYKHDGRLMPPWLRCPGTALPKVIIAGTYYGRGRKEFWCTRLRQRAVVFDLKDADYTRIVVDVDDPDAVLAEFADSRTEPYFELTEQACDTPGPSTDGQTVTRSGAKDHLMLRAVLAFVALPFLVAGLLPWLISRIPVSENFRLPGGAALLVLGSGILVASVVSFYRHGRGTLAPWDPPRHLVVQDLYRFNRNPMYLGVVLLTLGWALCTGNPWNYGYSVLVPIIFHLRVLLYEEREMERLFGREWSAYRDAVPRWGIAFHPYSPTRVDTAIARSGGSVE